MTTINLPGGGAVRLLGLGDSRGNLNEDESSKISWKHVWGVLSTVSGAISAYHGYKRNNSVGWAIGWFIMGSLFPIVTPTIAFAQGFGKPARE